MAQAGGIVCLICGEPGSGKTAIARAIAYELGQFIRVSVRIKMLFNGHSLIHIICEPS